MTPMATVIFDFDSTLITCETLEEVLKEKIADPERMQQIKEITEQGMSGKMSFLSSLESRLRMATVSRQDFYAFGRRAAQFLTPGMAELIQELKEQAVDIWIVSGTVRDVLLPIGNLLGLPENRLLGISLLWSRDGIYAGIDATRPINRSKWEGAKEVSVHWSSPKIAVGDGITDYALYEHKLVDNFIAFTQNVRRQAILDKGVAEAHTVEELRRCLYSLIQKAK